MDTTRPRPCRDLAAPWPLQGQQEVAVERLRELQELKQRPEGVELEAVEAVVNRTNLPDTMLEVQLGALVVAVVVEVKVERPPLPPRAGDHTPQPQRQPHQLRYQHL